MNFLFPVSAAGLPGQTRPVQLRSELVCVELASVSSQRTIPMLAEHREPGPLEWLGEYKSISDGVRGGGSDVSPVSGRSGPR